MKQPAEPAVRDKPKRRWYQFSLRLGLVLVGLFCIAVAWIGNERTRLARRRFAIERIKSVGGAVMFDWEWERPKGSGPYQPSGIVELFYGDENARAEVVLVSFLDRQATPNDDDVMLVTRFPHLNTLYIEAGTISERVLEPVAELTELDHLSLTAVELSPASVKRLAPLQKLRRLRLTVKGEVPDDLKRQVRETLPNCSLDEYSDFP